MRSSLRACDPRSLYLILNCLLYFGLLQRVRLDLKLINLSLVHNNNNVFNKTINEIVG